ncbi:hypothetical protein [Ruegeria atlantica]|uniref:hypothetical protein n=1 Tax=Ruegeria atlantica TaxID=81569 RepID=UPI002493DC88|nr:hypothetical protein [Ruegeria atlantica]
MRFISNLRRDTLKAFAEAGAEAHGYLLSSHRITPAALQDAAEVRAMGLPLFADNGTIELIGEVTAGFGHEAALVRDEVKEIRRTVGRIPRGRDVPDALRDRASALADSVTDAAEAQSEMRDHDALLAAQLSMDPTDLIANEDFGTACLMALGIEREITRWSVDRYRTLARRSIRLWRRVAEDPAVAGRLIYAVLGAVDYNTARAAGQEAMGAGVRNVALSVASFASDPTATDFYVMGTASLKLARPAPRRYVRLAQVVRGLSDGARDAGGAFDRLHCLGLGAPPLLPVAALGLAPETELTTDATSPIHAAVKDRVLYDPEARGDRATTIEIVERIMAGGDWPFVSPFASKFREEFGYRPEDARRWWSDNGEPPVDNTLLSTPSDLTEALPLFAEADPDIQPIARETRIAHNHWVIGMLAAQRSQPDRHKAASEIIEGWLAGPSTVTARGLAVAKEILSRPAL